MHRRGHVDGHLHRKHWCTRVCGRIAPGSNVRDLDISRRKEISQSKDDSLLIEANDINRVGHTIVTDGTFAGFAYCEAQCVVYRQLLETALKSIQRVPVARDQHEHCELGAEGRHATLFDVAAAAQDDLANVLYDASSIGTNS